MKLLLILMLYPVLGFAVCTSNGTGGGNWSAGATWTGCAGAGGVPATTDNPTVAAGDTVTLNTSPTVVTLSLVGKLVSDCSGPHTLTLTSTSGPQVNANGVLNDFSQKAVLDTSACTAGQEVTFDCTASTSNSFVTSCIVQGITFACTTVNLYHVIFKLSTNYGFTGYDAAGCNFSTLNWINATGGIGVVIQYGEQTSHTSNITWTGGSGTAVVIEGPTICAVSNITVLDPIGNSYGVGALFAGGSTNTLNGCQISGISINGDVAGTHQVAGVSGGNVGTSATPTHASYVAANQTDNSITGAGAAYGWAVLPASGVSSGVPFLVDHTSCYNCINGIQFSSGSYMQASYNVTYQVNNMTGQGCYFAESSAGVSNLVKYSICVMPDSSGGNLAFYVVPPGGAANVSYVFANDTSYTISPAGGGATGDFGLGEGLNLNVSSPSGMYDNISDHGYISFFSVAGNSVFDTIGTGGVGISNNDSWNPSVSAYFKATPSTNFDNGVTAHPSSIYGDVSVNPFHYEHTRTYARCDEILKSLSAGAGTAEDLFTELGKQWNGTNNPLVTPQTVWICMYVPMVPQNPALNNLSRAGTFIGAQQPVILSSGALRGRR